MWRRMWAWAKSPILDPAQPKLMVYSGLADRFDSVKLILLTALDKQDDLFPDDRNAEVIDLACDVLGVLGVALVQPERGEIPTIPGRTS